jgi:outer membrane protein TolC
MKAYAHKIFPRLLLTSLLAPTFSVQAMSLEQYLADVQKRNKEFQSLSLQKEAAELKLEQGDLALSPYLLVGAKRSWDETPLPLQYVPMITRTDYEDTEYSLGVSKKFSTGTDLKVMLIQSHADIDVGRGMTKGPYLGILSASLSQSLWKDFFGQGTRIRRRREEATKNLEQASVEVKRRTLLSTAESAYWQLLFAQQELKVREDSLARADRLVKWNKRRVGDGLAQSNELLQTEALYTQRELQLITAKDDYLNAQRNIKEFLDEDASAADKMPSTPLTTSRASLVQALQQGERVRADAWLSKLEAELQAQASRELAEGLKPDLVVKGTYGMSDSRPEQGDALRHTFDNRYPSKSISLNLTMDLDWWATAKVRRSGEASAKAASIRASRLALDSKRDIVELKRRYQELGRRIETVQKLVDIQKRKFDREQDRLRNGRSTTFQVISYEQEIAESEVMLFKLLSEQRKIESTTRNFIEGNI